MSFSLDAALSGESVLGHLAYIFLVASMVMRRMLWLRIFAVASFATGMSYSIFILADPVGTFWKALLVAINLIQLTLVYIENRRARFAPQERQLIDACFPGVPPGLQRALLNLGRWETLPPGSVLAQEGVAVPALVWIAKGAAKVTLQDRTIARLKPGALVGEMTVSSAGPANGTVTLTEESLLWLAPAETVRKALQTRPQQATALQAAFFRAVSSKLVQTGEARG